MFIEFIAGLVTGILISAVLFYNSNQTIENENRKLMNELKKAHEYASRQNKQIDMILANMK